MVNHLTCLQEKVITIEQADNIKDSLDTLSRKCFFPEISNGRWRLFKEQPPSHRYVNPYDSWFVVKFGDNGNVIEENISLQFSEYKNYRVIKKIICIALRFMAEKMLWQGETRFMSMSIMQHYNLQKGESTSGIPWHCDNSDHTLVILLEDETKWTGGEFHFKVSESEQQSFQPKRGYGVLFSNNGTLHSVEPLTAKADGVDRTILTIHEKVIQ